MFCFSCGNQLPDDARFCNKCGATLQPETPEAQPAYTEPQPAQPVYSEPQPAQPVYSEPQPAQPMYTEAQPAYTEPQPAQPAYTEQVYPRYDDQVQPRYDKPEYPLNNDPVLSHQYTGPGNQQQTYTQQPQHADVFAAPQKKRIPKWLIILAAAVVVVVIAIILIIPALGGNSYEKAEMKFLSGLVSGAGAGGGWDFTVEYEPSRQLSREMDIPSVELDGSFFYANQEAAARLALWTDGDPITEILCAFNEEGLSIAFPDITEYYLQLPTGGRDTDLNLDNLDMKKLQATFKEIGKQYFALAREISVVEKGVPLSFGSSTIRCDVYTMEFREQATAAFMAEALREVRKNSNLLDYITDIVVAGGGRARDVERALDDLEDSIDDLRSNKRLFQMTVWVSGGKIVARQIDRVMDADFALSYQNLQKGNDAHIELKATLDRYKVVFSGDFEKSRNGWNGTPRFTVTDTYYNEDVFSLKAKCENMDRSGDAVLGVIKIDGNADSDMEYSIKLTFGKDGNRQTVKLEAEFEQYSRYNNRSESIDFGSLTLSYARDKNSGFGMPEFDESMAVIINSNSSSNSSRAEKMYNDIDRYYQRHRGNEIADAFLGMLRDTLYYMW